MDSKKAAAWIKDFTGSFSLHGVSKADILYISSDACRLLWNARKNLGVKTSEDIDAFLYLLFAGLQEFVGDCGTLLLPVFSWDYCRKGKFDLRSTPGEVGILGDWLMNHPCGFVRTRHPIYSFMVYGRHAGALSKIDSRDGWDEDSVFGFLYRNHAKNILLDVNLERSFTFSHFVEKIVGVPFRYTKDFEGYYTDAGGNQSIQTYSMYVRDLAIISEQKTQDDCLVEKGVALKYLFDNFLSIQIVDLAASFPHIQENLEKEGGSEWYKFEGYTYNISDPPTHDYEIKYLSEYK